MKTVQIQRPSNCTGFKLNADRDEVQILAMKKTVDELKKKNLARKIIKNSRYNGSNSHSISHNQRNVSSNNTSNVSRM
jgi:hypothetical protein